MIATVVGSQPSEHVITLAQVLAGDVNAQYTTRAVTGGPTSTDQFHGIAVRDLIQQDIPLPISAVTFVEIDPAPGVVYTLSQSELGDPSDAGYPFPSGLRPAIFRSDGSTLGYIAPLRNDTDRSDEKIGATDGAIGLTIHTTGKLLDPLVTPRSPTVAAGTTLGFTASFASAPDTAITYDWDFGNGPVQDNIGAAPSTKYTAVGTYLASVTVHGADGSLGISKPVLITVGAAQTTGPGAGGGTGPTPGPTTGPAKGGGKVTGGATSTKSTTSEAKDGTGSDITGDSGTGTQSLPQVTGILISGTPQSVKKSGSSARQATAPSSAAGGLTAFGWGSVAAAAAVAALLGSGILAETGVLRRSRRRSKKGTS